MNRCLICFGPVEETINNNFVCKKCILKFEVIEKEIIIDSVPVYILYSYNDFFKELLYRYKGCYDEELKNAFLSNYLFKLSLKYKEDCYADD